MVYYRIISGSVQDINTAKRIFNKMPKDLGLQYFIFEYGDGGNVIREIGGDEDV